jgi:hypothetical protein
VCLVAFKGETKKLIRCSGQPLDVESESHAGFSE